MSQQKLTKVKQNPHSSAQSHPNYGILLSPVQLAQLAPFLLNPTLHTVSSQGAVILSLGLPMAVIKHCDQNHLWEEGVY